jgi:hypothetical protein
MWKLNHWTRLNVTGIPGARTVPRAAIDVPDVCRVQTALEVRMVAGAAFSSLVFISL